MNVRTSQLLNTPATRAGIITKRPGAAKSIAPNQCQSHILTAQRKHPTTMGRVNRNKAQTKATIPQKAPNCSSIPAQPAASWKIPKIINIIAKTTCPESLRIVNT